MLAFLDLPREIRLKILSFIITPAQAPQNALTSRNRAELHDVEYNGYHGGDNVKYAYCPRENKPGVCPTLLVNHQLHAETLAALDILPTKNFYVLDIMIVDEKELWPTWLSVPALTTRVDKVYAAFRIMGTAKYTPSKRRYGPRYYNGFTHLNAAPPTITWSFYSILQRFLRVGAKGPQAKVHDEFVSIKILELDVRTPDVAPEMLPQMESFRQMDCEADHMQSLREANGIDYLIHPESVARFIGRYISQLLSMDSTTSDYGGILFERIGAIKLMVDGELRQEWDLAEMLSTARFNRAFGRLVTTERRLEAWKQWKAAAFKTRIRLGLPVIPLTEETS